MKKSFLSKYGFILLGIVGVLPFLLLSFFVHPVGVHEWDWVAKYPGQLPAGLSFWEEQIYWYNNVMGRYTSTAMLSTTDWWFSISTFKIFPVISMIALFSSLHFLVKSFFLQLSHKKILPISLGLTLLYLDQLTGVFEAFYNLASVFTYQAGAMFFFLMSGLVIRFLQNQKLQKWRFFLLAGSLCFLIVGTNEISLISANAFLFLILAGGYFYHKKWNRWILGLFVLTLIFSLVEILAPGNYARMNESPNANRIGLTLLLTFSVTIFNWLRWLATTPLLLFILLYLPFGISFIENRKTPSIFRYPLFSFFGMISFQMVCLFLLFWSVGDDAFPERVMDIIFLTTLPCLLFFTQSMLEFLFKKNWITKDFRISKNLQIGLFAFVAFYLFFNGLKIEKSESARSTSNYISIIQTNSNIGTAWLELFNGRAASYNRTQNELYRQVQSCQSDTCLIDYPATFPKIIYDDTFDRKTKKGELFMGYYFNQKKQIVKYTSD